MGLEAVTYVNDLVVTNPVVGDDVAQGDDHLRAIKTALKTTFPNADKPFYFPDFGTKSADFTVLSTEIQKTFLVDTSGGDIAATLPALVSGDDGWVCHFIKTGSNVLFIAPPSGTIQSGEVSGLAHCRRKIPGHRCTAMWTGSAWMVTRVPSVPIGTELEFVGATLPVGYEWPNGQSFNSTDYAEYVSVIGTSTQDSRGRVTAGKDNMGGTSADRLTNANDGLNGDSLGATGGGETQTLGTDNLPAYTPSGSITGTTITAQGRSGQLATSPVSNGTGSPITVMVPGNGTFLNNSDITVGNGTFVGNAQGGTSTAFGIVQPTIIKNKMLVVE